MPTPPKKGKKQLEERRDLIRSLLARGINKPARILKVKEIPGYYEGYKNVYGMIKKDIEAVRKENVAIAKALNKESVHGELISQIEETIQQAWSDYGKLGGHAKVSMIRTIRELYKDLARLNGMDPEKIDSPLFKVDIDNKIEGMDPELKKDVAEFSQAFEKVAELFENARDNEGYSPAEDLRAGLSEDGS